MILGYVEAVHESSPTEHFFGAIAFFGTPPSLTVQEFERRRFECGQVTHCSSESNPTLTGTTTNRISFMALPTGVYIIENVHIRNHNRLVLATDNDGDDVISGTDTDEKAGNKVECSLVFYSIHQD
jgi:hypothetical protein